MEHNTALLGLKAGQRPADIPRLEASINHGFDPVVPIDLGCNLITTQNTSEDLERRFGDFDLLVFL